MITRDDAQRALAQMQQPLSPHNTLALTPGAFEIIENAGTLFILAGGAYLNLISIYFAGAVIGHQLALAQAQRLAGETISGDPDAKSETMPNDERATEPG